MQDYGMPFYLVKDGKPGCVLQDCQISSVAGEVLSNGLESLAGIKIPLLSRESANEMPILILGLLEHSPVIREILAQEQILLTDARAAEKRLVPAGNLMLFPEDLGSQGFVIYGTTRENQAVLLLTANTEQGLYYAVQTLLNRLYKKGRDWRVFGIGTRFLPVLNRPAFDQRSLASFISGPCFMMPGQLMREFNGDYRAFIDWLGKHKFNHFLDWSFTLDAGLGYDSQPYPKSVNLLHPNVKEEYMGAMLDYAHERHIEVWLFFKLPFRDYTGNKSNTYGPQPEHDVIISTQVQTRNFDQSKKHPLRMVCLSNPQTKKFWRDHLTELLTRYPTIDGMGCEIGEHLESYCKCPKCEGRTHELGYEYYKIMVETVRGLKPQIKLWFYRAAGASMVAEKRAELGNPIMIGWGYTQFWRAGRSVPRGDWLLCHTGDMEHAEAYLSNAIRVLHRENFAGIQIRATKYKAWESKYRAFEEFTWLPNLSLKDFALLNVLREEREINRSLIDLYTQWLLWLEAEEVLKFEIPLRIPAPLAWMKNEQFEERRHQAAALLQKLLKKIKKPTDMSHRITQEFQRINYSYLLRVGEFPVQQCAKITDKPWLRILTLQKGGYAENTVHLRKGNYTAVIVIKNPGMTPCRILFKLNGKQVWNYVLNPAKEMEPHRRWLRETFNWCIPKQGFYHLRFELAEGESCSLHRFTLTSKPENFSKDLKTNRGSTSE